jgi:hypothetical protein
MNAEQLATTIRQPSVANLMIDSADRLANYPSPWDFQIVKKQSLFNGFFTRIGATEVVLEWQNPNIITGVNSLMTFLITGIGGAINVNIGGANSVFSTVGDIMDTVTAAFNVAAGSTTAPFRFNVVNVDGDYGILDSSGAAIVVVPGSALSGQLNWQGGAAGFLYPIAPDIRPYRYIDFVSSQLTYNQNLKDATSNLRDQSVLVRWYFSFDNPTPSDQYGFPILMGYQPFVLRRIYSPPKQIAWESNMPIGQVGFQVFGDDGNIVSNFLNLSNWLMTLQISEN